MTSFFAKPKEAGWHAAARAASCGSVAFMMSIILKIGVSTGSRKNEVVFECASVQVGT